MEDIVKAFGLDIKLFVAQLVNFGILFLILAKYVYPKLLKVMDERTKKIEDSLKLAEKIEKDAEVNTKKQEEVLEKAKTEARAIIAETTKQAGKEREAFKTKAEEEAKRIIETAKKEIEKEKVQMIAEVKKEVSDIAIDVAGKILAKSYTNEDKEKLKREIVEGIS